MEQNFHFLTIETHSPENYLANQVANPFGVVYHDLPDRIEIDVADAVLQDAAFPSRELLAEQFQKLEGVFTQEGIAAALRNKTVPDAAFIYADPDGSGLARLYFSVRGCIENNVMKISIEPKEEG